MKTAQFTLALLLMAIEGEAYHGRSLYGIPGVPAYRPFYGHTRPSQSKVQYRPAPISKPVFATCNLMLGDIQLMQIPSKPIAARANFSASPMAAGMIVKLRVGENGNISSGMTS